MTLVVRMLLAVKRHVALVRETAVVFDVVR